MNKLSETQNLQQIEIIQKEINVLLNQNNSALTSAYNEIQTLEMKNQRLEMELKGIKDNFELELSRKSENLRVNYEQQLSQVENYWKAKVKVLEEEREKTMNFYQSMMGMMEGIRDDVKSARSEWSQAININNQRGKLNFNLYLLNIISN